MSTTHTRTHVYITFANPYLTCDECHAWVTAWHDNVACGCRTPCDNRPCGHPAGVTSACPSWSPVDGCQCLDHLGHVPHDEPTRVTCQPFACSVFHAPVGDANQPAKETP